MQVQRAPCERVCRRLEPVALAIGQGGQGVLHVRSVGEHRLPVELRDVVVVQIDRKATGRPEGEIERCAALQRQGLAQKGMTRDVAGQLAETHDLLERRGLEPGLGAAALQVVEANAHRPRRAERRRRGGRGSSGAPAARRADRARGTARRPVVAARARSRRRPDPEVALSLFEEPADRCPEPPCFRSRPQDLAQELEIERREGAGRLEQLLQTPGESRPAQAVHERALRPGDPQDVTLALDPARAELAQVGGAQRQRILEETDFRGADRQARSASLSGEDRRVKSTPSAPRRAAPGRRDTRRRRLAVLSRPRASDPACKCRSARLAARPRTHRG